MVHAYKLGLKSSNNYDLKTRVWLDAQADEITVQELTQFKLAHKSKVFLYWLRWIEFSGYLTLAILIHAIVVIPALILRIVSYLLAGEPFIDIIKPVKRSDLY